MRQRRRKKKSVSSKKIKKTQRKISNFPKRRKNLLRDDIRYDRREFRPLYDDGIKQIDGTPSLLIARPPNRPRKTRDWTRDRIGFKDPRRALTCIRRRERRESLFKAGKIGKGIRGPKKRKYNEESQMRC